MSGASAIWPCLPFPLLITVSLSSSVSSQGISDPLPDHNQHFLNELVNKHTQILQSLVETLVAMHQNASDVCAPSEEQKKSVFSVLDGEFEGISGPLDQVSQKLTEMVHLQDDVSTTDKCSNSPCPYPFFVMISECFCFVTSKPKFYVSAKKQCNEYGATLAEPKDFRRFIYQKRVRLGEESLYIGIDDYERTGNWTGPTGTVHDLTDAPWSPGYPNVSPTEMRCLIIGSDHLLQDVVCSEVYFFACEYNSYGQNKLT